MKKGDIILASLPIGNGSYKMRPALIMGVFPPYNDCLLCGISSQIKQNIQGVAHVISKKENYFEKTGLLATSVVRLNYLGTLSNKNIAGKIGVVPRTVYTEILEKLITLIKS